MTLIHQEKNGGSPHFPFLESRSYRMIRLQIPAWLQVLLWKTPMSSTDYHGSLWIIMDYHHFYHGLSSCSPCFPHFRCHWRWPKNRHHHPFVASEAPRSCECSPGSWSKPHLNPRKNGHLRVKISLSHDGSMVLLYMVIFGVYWW